MENVKSSKAGRLNLVGFLHRTRLDFIGGPSWAVLGPGHAILVARGDWKGCPGFRGCAGRFGDLCAETTREHAACSAERLRCWRHAHINKKNACAVRRNAHMFGGTPALLRHASTAVQTEVPSANAAASARSGPARILCPGCRGPHWWPPPRGRSHACLKISICYSLGGLRSAANASNQPWREDQTIIVGPPRSALALSPRRRLHC